MPALKRRLLRLDDLLVERALFDDAKTARGWIAARKVRVGDQYETKPATRVPADAALEVVGLDRRYVSRGGDKLAHALARFAVDPRAATVLDAGASTGGFTDCLLQHGAARVYAVDVGFGQLRGKLASDPRVVSLERTNIGDLRSDRFDPPLDLCTADLSYLSLRVAIPLLAALFAKPGRLICLVKPLFEGVPDAERARATRFPPVFRAVSDACSRCGLGLADLTVSPILGSNDTVEFFALAIPPSGSAPSVEALSERALREAAERFPGQLDLS